MDLDELERLAKVAQAAQPGEWTASHDHGVAVYGDRPTVEQVEEDGYPELLSGPVLIYDEGTVGDAVADFIAAANPATVLSLVEQIRKLEGVDFAPLSPSRIYVGLDVRLFNGLDGPMNAEGVEEEITALLKTHLRQRGVADVEVEAVESA